MVLRYFLNTFLTLSYASVSYVQLSQAETTDLPAFDDYLAYNDTAYAVDELSYLDDIPLISAATRLPQQRHESPASVTIIDRAMIEASSALTIPDLFRLVPGMQAYHTSANTSGVAYHGMTDKFPSQMEVMIDGRSIYVPLLSTVIWDTLGITVDDIDHIEVVRGSNSATHGSNAFIGAINIITYTGLGKPGSSVKYTLGSQNTHNAEVRHRGSYELGSFALSAGELSNDGSDRFNDAATRRYLNYNTVITPNLRDTLTVNLGLSEGFTNIGDIDTTPNLVQRDYHTNSQYVKWQRVLEDEAELALQYSHNYSNLEAAGFDIPTLQAEISGLSDAQAAAIIARNPFRLTPEVGDIEQHDIELSWRKQYSPENQLILGAGYKFNRARSLELLNTTDWISEERSRIFFNWENTRFDRWVFNSGAMLEHTTAGKNQLQVSPRFAANYQLTPTSGLRSSVSQAFRAPSILEANQETVLYNPGAGPAIIQIESLANKDLESERIKTIDFGYFKNWPEHNSQLDVRLFYEAIDNGINTAFQPNTLPTVTADPRYRTETNGAEWENRGIETQIRYQPNIHYSPLVVLNYSYIDARGVRNRGQRNAGDPDEIDRLEERTPFHTASILASMTLPSDLLVSVNHFYLASVNWLEGSSVGPNDAYNRTDLKLSQGFQTGENQQLKVSLIVQNLWDNEYQEFYTENIFDRRTYLQLELSF